MGQCNEAYTRNKTSVSRGTKTFENSVGHVRIYVTKFILHVLHALISTVRHFPVMHFPDPVISLGDC